MQPVTINGTTYPSLADASRSTGVPYMALYMRTKKYGWGEDELDKPVEQRRYRHKRAHYAVNVDEAKRVTASLIKSGRKGFTASPAKGKRKSKASAKN